MTTALGGESYFVLDAPTLARELRGPGGVVARAMTVKAENVKQEAIRLAPVGKGDNPGTLRSHIVKRGAVIEGEIAWLVGPANVAYAIFVSRGTPPHIIRGNPLLSFYWEKAGAQVVTRFVNHPGTKPNDYLTRALKVIH